MKIKPRLIIYRASRTQLCPLSSVKYNHLSRKINYQGCLSVDRQGSRLKWFKERSLNKVTYNLDSLGHSNQVFFELVKKAPCVDRLSLEIHFDSAQKKETQAMKTFIRKLFSRTKRIAHLDIILCRENNQKTSFLSHLRLLKFINKIAMNLYSLHNTTLKSLQTFLFSPRQPQTFPYLQFLNISFELEPKVALDQPVLNDSLESLHNALEIIKTNVMRASADIKLRLPLLRSPDLQISAKLVQSMKDLPSLASLGLGFDPNVDIEASFSLQVLQNCQNLKTLDLCLYGKQAVLLTDLAVMLQNRNSLKKVVIWISNPPVPLPLEKFFSELFMLSQITHFILNCKRVPSLSDNSLFSLANSLSNLQNLQSLDLNFSEAYAFTQITSNGLENVFVAIGRLVNLIELEANFSGYGEVLTGKVFKRLCESIKQLKGLSNLKLNFSTSMVGNKGIADLRKALEGLVGLHDLSLDFRDNKRLKSENFVMFVESLSKLRNLAVLTIKFEILELNKEIQLVLVSTLHKLKCLNVFSLHLDSLNYQDEDICEQVWEALESFGGRILIGIDEL